MPISPPPDRVGGRSVDLDRPGRVEPDRAPLIALDDHGVLDLEHALDCQPCHCAVRLLGDAQLRIGDGDKRGHGRSNRW